MEIQGERDELTSSLAALKDNFSSLQQSEIENSHKDNCYQKEIEQLKEEIQILQQLHGECEQSNEVLNQRVVQLESDYQAIWEENENSVQIVNELQNEIQTLTVCYSFIATLIDVIGRKKHRDYRQNVKKYRKRIQCLRIQIK